MERDKFERYAFLKNRMKEDEAEVETLQAEIVPLVEQTDEKRVNLKGHGMFSITTRKNWKYSSAVGVASDALKVLKTEEEQTGVATATESRSLRFEIEKPAKKDE